MNSREEVLRQFGAEPARWADYTLALHQQLAEHKQLLSHSEEMLRQAQQVIAELKIQLFGPKSDKLTPEQEGQLQQLSADLQDQAQRPPALSQDLLQEEQQLSRQRTDRRRRHFTPVELETQRIVLELPEEEKSCEHCHKAKKKIGEE